VGLVVEVKGDRVIVLEGPRHRRPERGRVVEVRHALLPIRLLAARRVPVQIENHVQPHPVQASHVPLDSRAVVALAICLRAAVDTQPAVLVQGNANRVDPPGRHRRDCSSTRRSGQRLVPVDAGVLGTRAVHPEQAERMTVPVHQLVPGNV
jgi:hypothetical protein